MASTKVIKDVEGNEFTIELPGFEFDKYNLAESPIVLRYDGEEDLFSPIRRRSCEVRFVTDDPEQLIKDILTLSDVTLSVYIDLGTSKFDIFKGRLASESFVYNYTVESLTIIKVTYTDYFSNFKNIVFKPLVAVSQGGSETANFPEHFAEDFIYRMPYYSFIEIFSRTASEYVRYISILGGSSKYDLNQNAISTEGHTDFAMHFAKVHGEAVWGKTLYEIIEMYCMAFGYYATMNGDEILFIHIPTKVNAGRLDIIPYMLYRWNATYNIYDEYLDSDRAIIRQVLRGDYIQIADASIEYDTSYNIKVKSDYGRQKDVLIQNLLTTKYKEYTRKDVAIYQSEYKQLYTTPNLVINTAGNAIYTIPEDGYIQIWTLNPIENYIYDEYVKLILPLSTNYYQNSARRAAFRINYKFNRFRDGEANIMCVGVFLKTSAMSGKVFVNKQLVDISGLPHLQSRITIPNGQESGEYLIELLGDDINSFYSAEIWLGSAYTASTRGAVAVKYNVNVELYFGNSNGRIKEYDEGETLVVSNNAKKDKEFEMPFCSVPTSLPYYFNTYLISTPQFAYINGINYNYDHLGSYFNDAWRSAKYSLQEYIGRYIARQFSRPKQIFDGEVIGNMHIVSATTTNFDNVFELDGRIFSVISGENDLINRRTKLKMVEMIREIEAISEHLMLTEEDELITTETGDYVINEKG